MPFRISSLGALSELREQINTMIQMAPGRKPIDEREPLGEWSKQQLDPARAVSGAERMLDCQCSGCDVVQRGDVLTERFRAVKMRKPPVNGRSAPVTLTRFEVFL